MSRYYRILSRISQIFQNIVDNMDRLTLFFFFFLFLIKIKIKSICGGTRLDHGFYDFHTESSFYLQNESNFFGYDIFMPHSQINIDISKFFIELDESKLSNLWVDYRKGSITYEWHIFKTTQIKYIGKDIV